MIIRGPSGNDVRFTYSVNLKLHIKGDKGAMLNNLSIIQLCDSFSHFLTDYFYF